MQVTLLLASLQGWLQLLRWLQKARCLSAASTMYDGSDVGYGLKTREV